MKKAKKKIREMLEYILDLDDKDVIEGYAGTFDDILESYAKRHSIEFAIKLEILGIRCKSKKRAKKAYDDLMELKPLE